MSRGVVLVRDAGADQQLQGLRTALSLSLGDRPADLLVTGPGLGALTPDAGTEAAHCLETLQQMSLRIEADGASLSSLVHHFAEVLPHGEFVARLAEADFVQVF